MKTIISIMVIICVMLSYILFAASPAEAGKRGGSSYNTTTSYDSGPKPQFYITEWSWSWPFYKRTPIFVDPCADERYKEYCEGNK